MHFRAEGVLFPLINEGLILRSSIHTSAEFRCDAVHHIAQRDLKLYCTVHLCRLGPAIMACSTRTSTRSSAPGGVLPALNTAWGPFSCVSYQGNNEVAFLRECDTWSLARCVRDHVCLCLERFVYHSQYPYSLPYPPQFQGQLQSPSTSPSLCVCKICCAR